MQVIALQECFASGAIRRPGQKPFEFEIPPGGSLPDFLQVVSEAPAAAPNDDIYASLSDEKIRRRLEDCLVKVPPLADRHALIVMLAEVEGKEIPKAVIGPIPEHEPNFKPIVSPSPKTKKGEKK